MAKIRVLLVDDHAILREGLRALLSYYDDVRVVGEAQDGAQAIARVEELAPDVVLMDIAMPGMNGLDATRAIRARHPQTRVLMLTQHDDREYVLSLVRAGALGMVSKRALGAELLTAIRAAARGETYLPPAALSAVMSEMRRLSQDATPAPDALTPRESEILEHIVAGKSNPQIAHALGISIKTVEWHRANLMSKLDLHSVADVVRYALEHKSVVACE